MSTSRPYPITSQTELAPVRVVATSNQAGTYFNGTLNNGVGATLTYTASSALTIDSVALLTNDYVLLAGQTLAYQNGIYQVTQPGSSALQAILTRRSDFQCIEQMQLGAYVNVFAGTVNAGSFWTMVEPFPTAVGNPIVSGANNINFTSTDTAATGTFLQITNNLSEIATEGAAAQASALGNLGVHSAKYTNAGGSATTSITDAKITAASVVVGQWQSSANAVTVEKVTPGSGTLTVLSSGDPGASVFSYIATSAVE